jgi:hypothetical protein
MGIKRPVESDFEVDCHESFVAVTFKLTNSHYTFNLLADEQDVARPGPVSPKVV